MVHVNLQGYDYCTTVNKNRFWRDRAMFHKRMAMMIQPLLKATEIYAPNNIVRKRMKDIARDYERLLGEPTKFQKAMEKGLVGMAGLQRFLDTFYPHDNRVKQEPFKRYTYDKRTQPDGKPYGVEYPHRSKRFRRGRMANRGLNGFLRGAAFLTDTYEELGGREFDDAMKRGNPINFLPA